MTTPMLMTEHPTEETLATYVDDSFEPANRREVTEHLASCGECREIVLMATEYQAKEATANVTRGTFGRRWLAAAGLAAAAAIAVVVVQPSWLFDPDVDVNDVVAASQGLEKRPSMGRLAGGFAYSERPEHDRGGPKNDGSGGKAELYGIAAKLEQHAPKLEDASLPNLHAIGLTRLLLAEEGPHFSAAVTALEIALEKARGEERDAITIDLAAALLEDAYWSKTFDENCRRALELSNDVLKRKPQSPEALWNRAVALDALEKKDEALRAWDEYLKVDPDSQWAQEAMREKKDLESGF